MDIIEGPLQVEPLKDTAKGGSQPIPALDGSNAMDLSDDAVRAAIAKAEAENVNPETLKIADVSQGLTAKPNEAQPESATPEASKTAVPEKFLKPDGEVDVEKLKASTEALKAANQEKQEKLSKTIDDYLSEYRAEEKKLRETPNPEKLAANLQKNPPPQPTGLTDDQLRQKLAEDFQRDFVGTTTDLIDIIVNRKMEERLKSIEEPIKTIEQEREINRVRDNLKKLSESDPRVLDPNVFSAINEKLKSDPDLWKLKNPHKAAWLEVKEELRLGDLPKGNQAQPSRNPSPILGGGTPPSTPSVTVRPDARQLLQNLDTLDLRDRRKEAEADAVIRAMLQGR